MINYVGWGGVGGGVMLKKAKGKKKFSAGINLSAALLPHIGQFMVMVILFLFLINVNRELRFNHPINLFVIGAVLLSCLSPNEKHSQLSYLNQ